MRCLHCKEAKRIRGRGLCYGCYMRHRDEHERKTRGDRSGQTLPRCIGCDREAPEANVARHGWHSKERILFRLPVKEVHCPKCFAEYGWGDSLCDAVADLPLFEPCRPAKGKWSPRVHTLRGGRDRALAMGLRM
jgi:hypothetical protein